MKEFSYTIQDELGIHARPAGLIVNEAKKYKSVITLECEGKKAVATKLLAIMSMGVKTGKSVLFTIEGEDEETAAKEFEAFIQETL